MTILLAATYELGHQPFALASAGAWLRRNGHEVRYVDLSLDPLPFAAVKEAGIVGFLLSMHTATRLAIAAMEKVRHFNPEARIIAFGNYAVLNRELLQELGVCVLAGGEFENNLIKAVDALAHGAGRADVPLVSREKLPLIVPDREGLPRLQRYAKLHVNGEARVTGYTEASRGCKHQCRHCPIVPVYDGVFRIVPREVVLADIRQQVAAGAQHITFGDADFFNGPGHAIRIVEDLHAEFPHLTYDVTIKISHLIEHRCRLRDLHRTNCLFVISAVESTEDLVLEKLNKGHTRQDFLGALRLLREEGITMSPTFVPFTPWTTIDGYRDLLGLLAEHDLADQVAPIQLALRLLVPSGSRILDLPETATLVSGFDQEALIYRWRNPDPRVDELSRDLLKLVTECTRARASRRVAFNRIWARVHGAPLELDDVPPRATIPFMDEPWYC